MHRLFLKSQTRRVLSSAQLKINFPPEWNRTPRTQLSWPTLCTRREQWAGWELSIPHLTRWQTEGPCLALQGQLLKPLRAHSLSAVSIITHTYQLSRQCKFLYLKANKQQSSCDLHQFCSPAPAPPPSPARIWAGNSSLRPTGSPTSANNVIFHRKQNSECYQHFCKQTKLLVTEPTSQYDFGDCQYFLATTRSELQKPFKLYFQHFHY